MSKDPPPLRRAYRNLLRHFGPQGWWPGRTRLEVCIGAILTQNTAWRNVEQALMRLKEEKALSLSALHSTRASTLAGWIRSAGYHNVKSRRVKAFVRFVMTTYDGSLRRMFLVETAVLREQLLSVHGIGPETADCILLYAGGRPVFVVDAYTRRVLARHAWLPRDRSGYSEVASLFALQLDHDVAVFNEYHALLVAVGKTYCRAQPRCRGCPLENLLPAGGPR